MTPHTYTAADFANLDPDALKALGVVGLWTDEQSVRIEWDDDAQTWFVFELAAALLIGMVAGRCDEFHCGRFRENYFWSELHGAGSTGGTSERVSPLAAALAAYGELVRSQRKEDGDGK